MDSKTFYALRDLAPLRRLSEQAAHELAEAQADYLLRLWQLKAPPVTEDLIATLPDVHIERFAPGPETQLCRAVAAAHRSERRWVFLLNVRTVARRQRWGLAHEIKHVLDDPIVSILYPADSYELREQVCDYFAACLLIPRKWLNANWRSGIRDQDALARRFGVTRRALRIRLLQVGIVDPKSHYIVKEV